MRDAQVEESHRTKEKEWLFAAARFGERMSPYDIPLYMYVEVLGQRIANFEREIIEDSARTETTPDSPARR